MSQRPEPPPEGRLITAALKRSRLSAREAARRAGISEGRWRQIAGGFQTVSGQHVPTTGPAETVARMALVVGLAADDLDGVRDDAAEIMRRDEQPSPQEPPEEDLVKFAKDLLAQSRRLEEIGLRILGEQTKETGEPRSSAG